ncbi:CDP-glycerol glycerophosphotransferase family protein [Heyndrickxia coagulans]|uniref:CDP-glycerol glycerophosphotransferase family protein n=1 Tax=Heyndrickxia coagulans TaxID=1398 RepID=UPI001A950E7F|nr:CDP-glycerol glycerophosphotransferase family protein [Heyndrickxia coagulans]
MVRELFISLYLLLFRVLFTLCKIFPLKRKITFVVSFEQNSLYVYEELKKHPVSFQTVFVCTSSCYRRVAETVRQEKVFLFEMKNLQHFIRSLYNIATSKFVIVDNYYGFLAAARFKKGVECIQLWHAAGAVKTFGLEDKTIRTRGKRALKRFKKVYAHFDRVVVGSEKMKHIFMRAFGLPPENFLCTGIPRTDLFFDQNRIRDIKKKLYKQYPAFQKKKVILYAPTFRDPHLDQFEVPLDWGRLYDELKDEYIFAVKFHPAVNKGAGLLQYPDFVMDCPHDMNINELLLVTDYLITDYSSVPFEFSLLGRPMIFYPYDLESYQATLGLWEPYDQLVPGPIACTTAEMIDLIKTGSFDAGSIEAFSRTWNTYSAGHSSRDLVQYLREQDEKKGRMYG